MEVMTNLYQIILFLIIIIQLSFGFSDKISDVTHNNFQSTTKDKKFIFLYVTSATSDECLDCRLLYNKFITAVQTFEDRDDIFFGKVSDETLIEMFEVDSFPEIVYYELGSADPKRYRDDITADAVEDLIVNVIRGDKDKLKRRYSVELTVENFDEIINNPDQYRLVMLHRHDDKDLVKTFEELAKTYDNEKEIVIARIDINRQRELRREFLSTDYPCFYWFAKGKDTKRKRYGGKMILKQMVQFLNSQTGFQRLPGGQLDYSAGLIKELDKILKTHIEDLYEVRNLDGLIHKLKKAIVKLNDDDKELGEYYIHLVEEVKEDNTIDSLGESRNRLFREMADVGPVKKDVLFKKTHISNRFVDLIAEHVMNGMGLPGDMGVDFGLGSNEDESVQYLDMNQGFGGKKRDKDPDYSHQDRIVFHEEL